MRKNRGWEHARLWSGIWELTCPAPEGHFRNIARAKNHRNNDNEIPHQVRPLARVPMFRLCLLMIWMVSGSVSRVVVGGGLKGYQCWSAGPSFMG